MLNVKGAPLWALTLIFLLPAAALTAQAAEDGSAAKVNGIPISLSRLEREMFRQEQQLLMQGMIVDETQRDAFRAEVLESLINQELVLQESLAKGYTAVPAVLEEQVAAIRAQFPDQDTFTQALDQWHYTEVSLREEIARGLAIQSYIEAEIGDQVGVTEEEAAVYYAEHPDQFGREEQVWVRHILIFMEEGAAAEEEQEARGRMEEIRRQLAEGRDFAELAREYSEGPNASRGGDLGYLGREDMVTPFEEAAFALAVGEVSDIVRTLYGFHLIELLDRRPAGLIPFEEVRSGLIDNLTQERVMSAVEALILKLREQAEIESFPEAG